MDTKKIDELNEASAILFGTSSLITALAESPSEITEFDLIALRHLVDEAALKVSKATRS